jgi:hypothetical protein
MPPSYQLNPVKEIPWKNDLGYPIAQRCRHALIPGLDADYCRTCRTWWVDQHLRKQLAGGKKK